MNTRLSLLLIAAVAALVLLFGGRGVTRSMPAQADDGCPIFPIRCTPLLTVTPVVTLAPRPTTPPPTATPVITEVPRPTAPPYTPTAVITVAPRPTTPPPPPATPPIPPCVLYPARCP